MNSPLDLPLGSMAEFDAAYASLSAQTARLELAYACGALLMLEAAFLDFPWVESVETHSDYEGGFGSFLMLRAPHGALATDRLVLRALTPPHPFGPPPGRSNDEEELATSRARADFSFLSVDQVKAAFDQFDMALDFFSAHANALFSHSLLDAGPLARSDALGLASALEMPEARAIVERSRLASASGDPNAQAAIGPRL